MESTCALPMSKNGNVTVTQQNKIRIDKNKNKNNITLPDFIDKELWDDFLEIRKKKRAPSTDNALKLIIKELEKLKSTGDEPNEVLKKSIMSGWTGVFPLKGVQGGTYKQTNKTTNEQRRASLSS